MTETNNTNFKVWYRPYYLNSVCHICKITSEPLLTCEKCQLVSYCGVEHQEDDLDDHEEICNALENVAKILGTKHALDKAYLLGPDEMRDFRLGLIVLCSKIMQRPLQSWEMEICLFPPICVTCHKFDPNIISCEKCLHIKWCSQHHKPKNHDKFCSQLILNRKILQKRQHAIPSLKLEKLPKNMDEIFDEYNKDEIEYCLLSEVATSPLTILNAIHENNLQGISKLIIHIIGPEPNFEASNLIKWESFLFDLLPPSVEHVQLDFIGPEIGPLNRRTVNKSGRILEFNFQQLLYHEYINNNKNINPNMIVAFNPGLYRTEGFQGKDSWSETISSMFRHQDVPVLITAYTEKEIKLDFDRIKNVVNDFKVILKPSQNALSSRRPLMNFVSDEIIPVVFKNLYQMIICK